MSINRLLVVGLLALAGACGDARGATPSVREGARSIVAWADTLGEVSDADVSSDASSPGGEE